MRKDKPATLKAVEPSIKKSAPTHISKNPAKWSAWGIFSKTFAILPNISLIKTNIAV